MKKRFLTALLCLGLMVGLLPVTASAYADVTSADGLAAALGNATASGNTVTLNNDVTLTDTINITAGTITLDFAGHTITGKAGEDGGNRVGKPGSNAITVSGTANLTLRGSGGITGGSGGMGSNGMAYDTDGDGYMNGGKADNGCNGGSALVVSGGTVAIEGGSFTGGSGGSGGVVKKELSKENDKAGDGGAGGSALSINSGTVNVSGGSFTGGSGGGGGTFDDGRSYNLGSSGPAGKAFAAAPVILNDSIVLVSSNTNTPTAVWNGTDDLTGFQSVTVAPNHDFIISGGMDYTYSNGVLTFTAAGTYTIGMKQGVATTDHRIVVDAAGSVTLNLNGVNITAPEVQPALTVTQGSVTLNAVAASSLQGGNGNTGMGGGAGIAGSVTISGGDITVNGGNGGENMASPTATAIGGNGGDGISGSVTVISGSITSNGGSFGIGYGGNGADGKGVGGTITAAPAGFVIHVSDSASSALSILTSPAATDKKYVAVIPNTPVAFTGLTANGSDTETTTALTLTFDKDIAGLAAGDITVTGATKSALTKESGIGVYTLAISNISVADGENVAVTVSKDGFAFTPASRTVAVRKYVPPITVTPSASFVQGRAPSNLTLNIGSVSIEPNSAGSFGALYVSADGANFSLVPADKYDLTYGSIHIALHQDYLNTLTPGTYRFRADLAGAFAGTSLTATVTVTTDPSSSDPETVYLTTEGAGGTWTQGASRGYSFTFNAPFSRFRSVRVDGRTIAASGYTTASGSTVLSLNPEYLATLSVGTHTIRAIFSDGYAQTTFTIAEAVNPFADVKESDWFYGDVRYVYENGLFASTSDTAFSPAAPMTRAMLVTVLWRMEGEPVVNYAMQFEDVAGDAYYPDAVRWAASEKLVEGYGNGWFGARDSITREQLVTILHRYAVWKGMDVSVGEDTNILSYEDAFDIEEYAIGPFQWACGEGLVQGDNGKLMPHGSASRCQVAAILHRFLVKATSN